MKYHLYVILFIGRLIFTGMSTSQHRYNGTFVLHRCTIKNIEIVLDPVVDQAWLGDEADDVLGQILHTQGKYTKVNTDTLVSVAASIKRTSSKCKDRMVMLFPPTGVSLVCTSTSCEKSSH